MFDKGSIAATQAVPPIIKQALNALADQTAKQDLTPIDMRIASLVETKPLSTFEFMAPGMFTFASIFIIMMVAQAFTQDRENGMMKRIRTTPITPTEFMTSQVLAYMLIALIQAVIVFTATYIMGFRPNVDLAVYALAFTLVTIFSISNAGFGLITPHWPEHPVQPQDCPSSLCCLSYFWEHSSAPHFPLQPK